MVGCSQRSHVQIEIKMAEYSDKEKLDKFIEIWPQDRVEEFSAFLINAQYPKWYVQHIDEYNQYLRAVLAIFDDRKIEETRWAFNNAFGELRVFLIKHFFALNEEWFALYPEKRKGLDGPDEQKFWADKNQELQALNLKFYDLYIKFLKTASQRVQSGGSRSKISITIDESKKEVIRQSDDDRLVHAFRRGKNKRFETLLKISKNPKIGASELSNNTQNLSKEIGKINNLLKDKLRLTTPIIINRGGKSGYEIDLEVYDLSLK